MTAGEPMARADLPAGLAEPLHILAPEEGSAWGWWWLLALLLLALWLYRRWVLGRRAASPPEPAAMPAPAPPTAAWPSDALVRAIDALRQEILASSDFRDGCHRLADLLRRQGEQLVPYRLTVLTAGEIVRRLDKSPLGTIFGLLADLQFRRADPTRREFEDICEMASSASRAADAIHRAGGKT